MYGCLMQPMVGIFLFSPYLPALYTGSAPHDFSYRYCIKLETSATSALTQSGVRELSEL